MPDKPFSGDRGGGPPEMREMGEKPEMLTDTEQAKFDQLLAEVEGRPPQEEIIDAEFTELTPEKQRQIETLEDEYNEQCLAVREKSAKSKIQLVGKAVMRVAKFFDLHTKEKLMTAALEVIPYVGLGYAVAGKRVMIDKDPETGKRSISFEDLSATDRVIYLAGEMLASGHALRGALNTIKREGAKKVLAAAGKQVAQNTGKLLVARGKQGLEREIGLLPGKTEPEETEQDES